MLGKLDVYSRLSFLTGESEGWGETFHCCALLIWGRAMQCVTILLTLLMWWVLVSVVQGVLQPHPRVLRSSQWCLVHE